MVTGQTGSKASPVKYRITDIVNNVDKVLFSCRTDRFKVSLVSGYRFPDHTEKLLSRLIPHYSLSNSSNSSSANNFSPTNPIEQTTHDIPN